ncbi:PD-(D/E)XK nuclease family protein [Coraliomargarita parva]|uniref:PD-(D/E)XK nuclease family protein n=1 Tax=Coraliomargarita parva TaxID=3014050 RepID=UPI0022B56190|nr:PD-(D/E)XK nuclease family protein [Coraliomargarita parva]
MMTLEQVAQNRISLARQIIDKYIQLKNKRIREMCAYAGEVLARYNERKERDTEENRQTSFQYNPLRTIPIGETTHSRVIGDLLDPNGTHGQGALFLNTFLDLIGHENATSGQWHVTVETGRVDICLWRVDPASVVIIENKSNWAVDQSSQLYRYWLQNIHSYYPDLNYEEASTCRNFKVVYMAPSIHKRPTAQSLQRPPELASLSGLPVSLPLIPVLFTLDTHLQEWCSRCMKHLDSKNERLRNFLKFYKEIWSK